MRRRNASLWEARVTVDGQRLSFYSKTRQEAQQKLLSARKAVQDNLPIARDTITVKQVVLQWLDAKRPPAIEATTRRGYAEKARNHVIPAWGHIKAVELAPRHASTANAGRSFTAAV